MLRGQRLVELWTDLVITVVVGFCEYRCIFVRIAGWMAKEVGNYN